MTEEKDAVKQGIVCRADGTTEIIDFTDETCLEVLQKQVGGYVELVRLHDGMDMWINEEGKLFGLTPNSFATMLWHFAHMLHGNPPPRDIIVGDVVLTGGSDEEGRTLGLTVDAIASYRERVNR